MAMPGMGLVLAEGVPAKVGKPETHRRYVGENGIEFSPAPSMLPPLLCILFSFAVLCPALAFMLEMKLELKGEGGAVVANWWQHQVSTPGQNPSNK